VGYVSGPSVKSGEAASLNSTNDDDVHGIFFVITRINSLNESGMSLHKTFSYRNSHSNGSSFNMTS